MLQFFSAINLELYDPGVYFRLSKLVPF